MLQAMKLKSLCEKEEKPKMSDQDRDSFLRWQEYRISQLSFSINLFLGFSVASIAFLVQHGTKTLTSPPTLNQELMLPVIWWLFSALFGVLATLSRLVDFRYTAKRIRGGRKKYFCLTKMAGHITWVSFGCQIASYCIGIWLFIV
jgi:predicted permease